MKLILTGIIIVLGFRALELYDITQNNQKQILDLSQRSYYIGCVQGRELDGLPDSKYYCKELSKAWRKELSENLGIKDLKGNVLEN